VGAGEAIDKGWLLMKTTSIARGGREKVQAVAADRSASALSISYIGPYALPD